MSSSLLNVGVVGATGVVGQEFLKILKDRHFPASELRLFASDASEGQHVLFKNQKVPLRRLTPHCFDGLDLVFFSSGDDISKEWAPQAVRSGASVVDNSAAFRMNPEILLCVPEINGSKLPSRNTPTLIANPNCSTIQLDLVLHPLQQEFGISAVQVATYQSVSGAGKAAVEELQQQTMATLNHQKVQPQVFPHSIAYCNLPHIGSFDETGFSSEEHKIMSETRKILDLPNLSISAFTVRTPTLNAHSEVAWVTLSEVVQRKDILQVLKKAPGLVVEDDLLNNKYPLNTEVSGKDPVYVGRIHQDLHNPKMWLFWIVSDNLRKGAALNAIQIAEQIFDTRRNS